jgi:nitroreductase
VDNPPPLLRKQGIRTDTFDAINLLAGQTIMLAAKSMGYDSCPMIGFDQVKIPEIINLPRDYVTGFMDAVDKAVKPCCAQGWPTGPSEAVVQDRFA